jgi:hypothetical protein
MDEIDFSYDTEYCIQCKLKNNPDPEICLRDRERIYANVVAAANSQDIPKPVICTQAPIRAFTSTIEI